MQPQPDPNLSPTLSSESEQRLLAEALRNTASVINQSLNLREVLELILDSIGAVVPHDSANLMLIEDGYACITAVRGYERLGVDKDVLFRQRRPVEEVPSLMQMASTGQPIVISDTDHSPNWMRFQTSGWIHSFVASPICHKGRTIGFLNLNSGQPGFFTPLHAERLRAFADQAAVAIENARLYERAQAELAIRVAAEEALRKAKLDLEERVEVRTAQLREAVAQLRQELERRQQAERALEEERASLARRVEERTSELSAANAELARNARLKDSFLANMSHELRTPLNAILNISETLEEQVYGPCNAEQLRSIHTIEESAAHLLALINDILDLSKIGANKLELNMDTVPVAALCRGSINLVAESANKKRLSVTCTLDPQVKTLWGDLRRLKQVLVNLLSNAVKFTPEGGSVALEVRGDRARGRVELAVSDTGIGIPPEKLGSLFKPFVQLDNGLARQYEGTGLGLALAYHLVEMHNGGIRVDSRPGQGSQFTISLPWEVEGEPEHAAGRANGPEGVEDAILKITRYLSEFAIETSALWLDAGAGERLAELKPDLILLNGPLSPAATRIAAGLRRMAALSQTQFLYVTSNGMPPGPELEGTAYIALPAPRREFAALLRARTNQTASLVRRAALLSEGRPAWDRAQPVVLLAEDNEQSARAILDYLSARGYRVVLANNGAAAIEMAREFRPDLILMDIQMPGMDGLEATRRIRADARIGRTPILALTALAMAGDRRRCLEAGANEYLSKPVSLKGLVEVIEKHRRSPDSPIA